jgi:ADP-ribose pyrophosphatase
VTKHQTRQPRIVARRTLHKGRKFDYMQVKVRASSGEVHDRQFVKHPGAIVVVAVLDTHGGKKLVMERVYRASVDAMVWECCAGTIDKGETPRACAARELIEETGYKAARLEKLLAFRTSPGLSDEMMHAFVARNLTHVGQKLEADEALEVHLLSVAETMTMLDRGEIADGKTIAALLLAERKGYLK